jgi:hypothetical protein
MRFSEGTFVERLSLMPALAIVAIVIVLMSFEFRLGNHFDSPAVILQISELLMLTNLTVHTFPENQG